MKKAEREEYAVKRAYELARTGEFSDHLDIEHAIRGEGFEEARHVLDDQRIRRELKELCERSKQEKGEDPDDGSRN